MQKSLFSIFSESKFEPIKVDLPREDESKPFHVQISEADWKVKITKGGAHIPISMLVFARSKEHALSRMRGTLKIVADSTVESVDKYGDRVYDSGARSRDILEKLESGVFIEEVEELDTSLISCRVNISYGQF